MIVDNIFTVPLIKTQIKNWENKKIKLLEYCNNLNTIDGEFLKTNYFSGSNLDLVNIKEILSEEIKEFNDTFNLNVKVTSSWVEKQYKGMCHKIHNHGQTGFSAVCFIDFCPFEHQATTFISPFSDFIYGYILSHIPQDVVEGTLLFFPSSILHYTESNKSEIPRTIASFNLSID
jgi:hypothetical protein